MRIVALGLLALLGLGVGAADAAPVATPIVAELPVERNGLKIAIVGLDFRADDPHINVALKNTSVKPIRVFDEGNSSGYGSLTLEISAVDGKVFDRPLIVARKPKRWLANSRSSQIIQPGRVLLRTMHFQTRDGSAAFFDYKSFPLPFKGHPRRVTMRAVFSNSQPIAGAGPAWTGDIASPWKNYMVVWKSTDLGSQLLAPKSRSHTRASSSGLNPNHAILNCARPHPFDCARWQPQRGQNHAFQRPHRNAPESRELSRCDG